jgi:hypothetical protein
MIQPSNNSVVDLLLDPVGNCLTREVAERLVGLRAAPQVQEKLDNFAEKSSEGTLTAEERAEYEASLRAINFISVLQSKARAMISRSSE